MSKHFVFFISFFFLVNVVFIISQLFNIYRVVQVDASLRHNIVPENGRYVGFPAKDDIEKINAVGFLAAMRKYEAVEMTA